MDEKPKTLDYATREEREISQFDDFIVGLFVGRLRSKWFYLQAGYYALLGLFFWVIAIQFGPNLVNFHSLRRPDPIVFKQDVEMRCVPVVRAMKEFERDQGRLPNDLSELTPKYLKESEVWPGVWRGRFTYRGKWNEQIVYDFTPGNEGWYVRGVFVNGRIPLPPVKLPPLTQPTTQSH